MRKIVAVICEYNPFHRGHGRQLAAIRDAVDDALILCMMSGNFVQRGEAAVYPKYLRAKAAILAGSDLVLELPYPWSSAPADRFAAAGVHIAAELGADMICFGHESPIEEIMQAATFSFSPTDRLPHDRLSFARAREKAYSEKTGRIYPTGANDRLAIEYLRAIEKEKAQNPDKLPDRFLALHREEDGFSAHRAREAIYAKNEKLLTNLLPTATRDLIGNIPPARMKNGFSLLLWALRSADPEDLTMLFDIPIEMGVRFCRTARQFCEGSYDDFLRSLSNPNDSTARLRRGLLTVLLRPMPDDLLALPGYTTLLGASEKGQAFLRHYPKNPPFPIYTKRADVPAGRQRMLEERADLLYGMFRGEIRSLRSIMSDIPYLPK